MAENVLLDEIREHEIVNAAYGMAIRLVEPDNKSTPEALADRVVRISRLLAVGLRMDFTKTNANA